MEKMRLLLADDHPDVLTYLATRLKREPGIDIVGEANNSAQAIALTLSEKPDLVLIDPVMKDGLGMNAIRQIAARCPETVIVVLTAVADTSMKIDLKKIGVTDILIKGIESVELVRALQSTASARV